MNAIRMRKENQIYSAEEKAALAMLNFEENKRNARHPTSGVISGMTGVSTPVTLSTAWLLLCAIPRPSRRGCNNRQQCSCSR